MALYLKKYWFKAKPYGYGWYPASWQGWLILTVFISLEVFSFFLIDSRSHSVSDTLINFVPLTFFLAGIMVLLARIKGEKLRWRWGNNYEK